MTSERSAGVEIGRLIVRDDDPPPEPGVVLIYVRPVDGIDRMLVRFSDGTVAIL